MSRRIVILLPALAGLCLAQESTAIITNPFNTDADIEAGGRTFLSQCASCHGRDGRGTTAAPDLSTGTLRRSNTDEGIFQIIGKGIPGTTMPGFQLTSRFTWQVVAYIRSLARVRKNQSVGGDASKGESLFRTHRCAGCHEGSAPDLNGIGSRRTLAELRQSIQDPNADVPTAYWRFRATTRDGRTLSGVRLNEDTFTVQYRDSKGLHSVARTGLASIEYDRTSPMPAFRDKLSASELDDLITFLVSRVAP